MVISRIKWKIIYVGHYAKWLSLLSWIVAKFRLKASRAQNPHPFHQPCQSTPHPCLILSSCYPNGLQANSCPRRLQSSAQKGDFFCLLSFSRGPIGRLIGEVLFWCCLRFTVYGLWQIEAWFTSILGLNKIAKPLTNCQLAGPNKR